MRFAADTVELQLVHGHHQEILHKSPAELHLSPAPFRGQIRLKESPRPKTAVNITSGQHHLRRQPGVPGWPSPAPAALQLGRSIVRRRTMRAHCNAAGLEPGDAAALPYLALLPGRRGWGDPHTTSCSRHASPHGTQLPGRQVSGRSGRQCSWLIFAALMA